MIQHFNCVRFCFQVVYNETGTYGTDLFTREADKVLNDHDATKPLFLYFAQQAVHVGNQNNPLQVPKKYLDRLGYIGDEKRRTFAGNEMMTERFTMMCQKTKLKSSKRPIRTRKNGDKAREN